MNRKNLFLILVVIPLIIFISWYNGQSYAGVKGTDEHHHHHEHTPGLPEPIVDLETSPETIKAQEPATIVFYIKDSEGNPLQDIAIMHERILHVVIVSEDFSIFGHIHPEDFGPLTAEMKKKGRFAVDYTFSKAGRYLIAADFGVKDLHFSKKFTINVSGEPGMNPLKKDFSREKDYSDYTVTLTSKPERITAGKDSTLIYSIKKNGKAVTDLEPYLGEAMHLAIITADFNQFIHAHGDKPDASKGSDPMGHIHGMPHDKYGPEIEARVVFPVNGNYKIFSEIRHQGKVILLDFMVTVE
ncbi:MAG: hypothetical protein AABZ11_02850 [Nitrospinota bacterium]